MTEHRPPATDRVVVSWEGPGEPIMLALYGPDGEVTAVPLLPKRALTLAQAPLTRGVQAIKADSWADMYGQVVLPGFTSRSRGRPPNQVRPRLLRLRTRSHCRFRH